MTTAVGCKLPEIRPTPVVQFLGLGSAAEDDAFSTFIAAWRPVAARFGLDDVEVVHRPVADLDADATRRDVVRHLTARHDLVIAPSGSTAMAAVGAADRGPVIFATYLDPVRSGLAGSMSRPGRRATGVSLQDRLHAKRLEILRDAYPGRSIVGVLLDRQWVTHFDADELIVQPARRLGLTPLMIIADDADQVRVAFQSARARLADAWYVAPTYVADLASDDIRNALNSLARPSIHASLKEVEAGSPLAYAQDEGFVYTAMADLACRVLKGADAGELAVVTPWRHVLAARPRESPQGFRIAATVVRRADALY